MAEIIVRLNSRCAGFDEKLQALLAWDDDERPEIVSAVREIIAAVKERGDAALLQYTNEFDRRELHDVSNIEIRNFNTHVDAIEPDLKAALEQAAERVRIFHERQKSESLAAARALVGVARRSRIPARRSATAGRPSPGSSPSTSHATPVSWS